MRAQAAPAFFGVDKLGRAVLVWPLMNAVLPPSTPAAAYFYFWFYTEDTEPSLLRG